MNRHAYAARVMLGSTAVTLVFCVLLLAVRFRVGPADSMVILFTYGGKTVWSDRYDESRFRSMQIGDKIGKVSTGLGSPIDTLARRDGSQVWSMAGPTQPGRPYLAREIRFDSKKRVVAKRAYYRRDGLLPKDDEEAAAKWR
jgi:hypothetical protein